MSTAQALDKMFVRSDVQSGRLDGFAAFVPRPAPTPHTHAIYTYICVRACVCECV